MLVSLNWLKEYVDIDVAPEELGEMLTMCGLELESLNYTGKGIEDIVVARILEVKKHPGADRLSICSVTDGAKNYDIICGADNVRPNAYVALAKAGAKLPPTEKFPDGLKIRKTKIRGEPSEGMLCAENELGLSCKSDGIMILSGNLSVGSRLADEMSLNDVILDLAITPNRPDCLSIFGIAREVSSILKKPLKDIQFSSGEEPEGSSKPVEVRIKDVSACPRYSCRVVEDVRAGPSPDWLKNRLQACGVRSINNIVDVTNFVMLETGQPLHAFDHDLLKEKSINVRFAEDKEPFVTLDGQKMELTENDLLICDGNTPVALGGVMGGLSTEVTGRTENILLEAAYFDPVTIRKTSKRTGIRSESSYRFERGVDPNNVRFALDRATYLIAKLAGGRISGSTTDVYPSPVETKKISLSVKKVENILGIKISSENIVDILRPLEFKVLETDAHRLSLQIPTFRVDVTREIDVIEEIGRLFGYNNIPMTLPAVGVLMDETGHGREFISDLKRAFISSGFFEAINYSFENPDLLRMFDPSDTINILNPLTSESCAMRNSMLPGLIRSVKTNLSHQVEDVRLFEHGKIYLPQGKEQLPEEITRFSAVATGKKDPEVWSNEDFGFFDLKNIFTQGVSSLLLRKKIIFAKNDNIRFLHPGKSASVLVDDKEFGVIGELHPEYSDKLGIDKKVYILDISVDTLTEFYESCSYCFKPVPRFPHIRRDVSFVVNKDVTTGQIIDKVKGVSALVEDADVFDIFDGSELGLNKKSVGISILIRSQNKTLTDEDANKVQNLAISELNSSLGAEIRSI